MEGNTIHAKDLWKSFKQTENNDQLNVLNNINVSFKQGKTYAITGASGSGKSTLLHILGGLDTPSKGTVLFNNTNISDMKSKSKEKLLNHHLGFVFQFHYLINELSVLENIMLMGLIQGKNRLACEKRAKTLLDQVDLADKADSPPFNLSGGQQQRVSILRAIFNKPDFLLADEPTGNLDAQNAQALINLLLQHQQEWNLGIIICSHDKAIYEKMNTIFELKNGNLKKL